MKPEDRIFTVAEADGLVPYLKMEFERVHRLRGRISEHFQALERSGVELDLDVIDEFDPQSVEPALRPKAARLKQMVKEVASLVSRLHERGCLVKDLRLGLVDFYSVIDGQPVFLCWQFGEETVAYFHRLDGGFASREPLPAARTVGVLYN